MTSTRNRTRCRDAYTLVELMVVVVTIGLIAGMAVASLKAPYRQARLEDGCQQALALDAQVRSRCERQAVAAQITWDITRGRVKVERPGGHSSGPEWPHLQLPAGVDIQEVLLAEAKSSSRNSVKVPIDRHGCSPSYALAIGRVGEEPRWFFVAGRTGQTTELESEREVQNVIRATRRSGPDAH